MKKYLLFLALALSALAPAYAQPRPKLVVGIVVDQMRWDYLYRYYSHYGSDGFKRLMRGGFNCQQAMINYLPSFTAPGHTCIYTGSVPAIHGIAGNDWFENGKFTYCTDDKTVQPVGGSKIWGQMSPRNLLTTTVTDELRLATNLRSRVFAVSLKDRSSILPGGHLANGAYWFDDSTGNFMTSSYYEGSITTMSCQHCEQPIYYSNPKWLEDFNSRRLPDSMLTKDWELRDDIRSYSQSELEMSDNTSNISRYKGKIAKNDFYANFPHRAQFFVGNGMTKYNTIRKIPAGNTLSLKLAKACIEGNALGQKDATDFLALSLSATDYAGHTFGPNALEMEDMYIRLDGDIARFLRYLDNHIGEGEYTVFLTADHGAAHNSLLMNDLDIPAGNVSESKLRKDLNDYLKTQLGRDSMVKTLENYQVTLNEAKLAGMDLNRESLLTFIRSWLQKRPEVQFAVVMGTDEVSALPEPIRTMAINGYYAPRCGKILIILKPGYYAGYAPTGTTHGTWNPYDTHIPLLFYGWGIRRGETYREVHMTDITATLSALLHIQMPNGCIGKVIPEALR